MRDLRTEVDAIRAGLKPGPQRIRAYLTLVGDLEALCVRTQALPVRQGLRVFIHKVMALANDERTRR
jgi:hypothetical protein